MKDGKTISIVIGSNEPEVAPFQFRYDRRGADLCYDRNDEKVILLVRHKGIALEGSNALEQNDEHLLEIIHCIQIDENDDTDNHCFVGGAFECSEDEIDVAHEGSEVHNDHVVASNAMTRFTKRFDNNETIAILSKQRLE